MYVWLIALFVVGSAVGGQVNRAIYRLAWFKRAIGPWSKPAEDAPPRHWSDRLPIVGWWGLRREAALHGGGFWIRPLLIELTLGFGFAALFWFELDQFGLMPRGMSLAVLNADFQQHAMTRYFAHVILLSLLVAATFIDFDEQTIPDGVTLPGTLLGLVFAVALPGSFMPVVLFVPAQLPLVEHLVVTSTDFRPGQWLNGLGGPGSWPAIFDGAFGLAVGLACLFAWCFAIHPRIWTTRRGWAKAFQFLIASMIRRRAWVFPAILALVCTTLVIGTWSFSGERWQALLTSLVGIAFGGGLVWAIRLIGTQALGMEAMGFGDVTLMAMIGAFLGWQSAFLIFFIAPFAALFIALAQWLITRERHIAFGPYLSLGTLMLIVGWRWIWGQWAAPMFDPVWLVPAVVVVMLIVMWIMLTLLSLVRGRAVDEPGNH